MTITEALAEIKTIRKRIDSKKEFVSKYLIRVDTMKDPLEKDGGSEKVIAQELQAIADLEKRIVELRLAIQRANDMTDLTVEGVTQTVSGWLVWRREIADNRHMFFRNLQRGLDNARSQQRTQKVTGADKPVDIVVAVDEKSVSVENEKMQKILGDLDGLLSLKNATVMID